MNTQDDATGFASSLTLALILGMAVVSDLRDRKISNRLILSGLVLSIILALTKADIRELFYVIRNTFIPVIFLYLFYLCGVIGAGDVKLFSIIGGFTTLKFTFQAVIWSFLIGGVCSLFLLLQKNRRKTISRHGKVELSTMPFSLAIAAGTFMAAYCEIRLKGGIW